MYLKMKNHIKNCKPTITRKEENVKSQHNDLRHLINTSENKLKKYSKYSKLNEAKKVFKFNKNLVKN